MKRPKPQLRPRDGRPPPPPEEREIALSRIGARGDAIADTESGPIYTLYALPGEVVRARVAGDRAQLLEVLTPSPERQAPACRHFGRCGGCQLQHWRDGPYLEWKREQVVQALTWRGLGGAKVEATVPAWGEGRRRATLHAAREQGQVRVGFIERGGARLTALAECPVLVPALQTLVLKLGGLAALALPQRGEITLACLATESGIDVAIKGAGKAAGLTRAGLERLSAVAHELELARLSFDGEPIVTRAKPMLTMGRAIVAPPPGAFLQPTVAGEQMLAALVLEALGGAARVIDLFSGIGTFALRIAERAEVLAVEGDAEMLAALKAAADGAGGGLKQVSVLRRDLLRTPLSSLEMKKYDAIVLDPPRSGAKLQAEQIARAGVRKLAYVSCEPSSFARDVKLLVEYGFQLTRVTPVDQFRWSPHVEVVGALER
jgi:23S rRNA (uracil1939-C5)-methyltransferase